jgi:hypothetical protein
MLLKQILLIQMFMVEQMFIEQMLINLKLVEQIPTVLMLLEQISKCSKTDVARIEDK